MRERKSIQKAEVQLEAVTNVLASTDPLLSSAQLLLNSCDDNMELLRKQYEHMEDNKRKQILQLHKEYCKIWCPDSHPDRYKTYLPDPSHPRGRRIIEARTKRGIEDKICAWYASGQHREKTFEDCYRLWFHEKKEPYISNSTKRRYEQDIVRFFQSSEEGLSFFQTPLPDLTEEDLHSFILHQLHMGRLCKEALKDLFRLIRSTCEYAWRKHMVETNPCERLSLDQYTRGCYPSSRFGRKETISFDEWALIEQQMYLDQAKGLMTAYAAEMLSLTGMRPGEAAGLRWQDIDDTAFYIVNTRKYDPENHIYYDGDVKNKMPREFPLTDEIMDLLKRTQASQEQQGIQSEYVFADNNGPTTTGKITSYIKNKSKQLGLSHTYCSYSIRKTVNSVTRSRGTATPVAASILGHSPQVNERYYTKEVATLEEKRIAAERMSLGKWVQLQQKTEVNTGQHIFSK